MGAGVLFDVGGGYKFAKHLAAGLSVWNTRSKSAAAAAASIPDPLFFGRFTTVTPTAVDELKQSTARRERVRDLHHADRGSLRPWPSHWARR